MSKPIIFKSKGVKNMIVMDYEEVANDEVPVTGVPEGTYIPKYSPKYGMLKMKRTSKEDGALYEYKNNKWVNVDSNFCYYGVTKVLKQINPKLAALFLSYKPVPFYLVEV